MTVRAALRVLKPGPRPAIAFGILTAIISAILLTLSPADATSEALKAVAMLAAVFGALLGHIYLSRIVVAESYIPPERGCGRNIASRLPKSNIRSLGS